MKENNKSLKNRIKNSLQKTETIHNKFNTKQTQKKPKKH